jgi:hypothetical protein
MKILLVVGITIVAAVGIMWWLGTRLPIKHRAGVAVDLRQTPEAVFDAISDVVATPQWRKDVKSVELLPADNGQPRYREAGSNGVIDYRIELAERPRRLVTRIDDPSLPFGGSWTFTIAPKGEGSHVEIVEDGEIRSIPFRFLSHYLFGYHGTLETYANALATKSGEQAAIQRL